MNHQLFSLSIINAFWYYVVIVVLLLLLTFFIYRVIKDNLQLFKNIGAMSNFSKILFSTFLFWSPLLVPIILAFMAEAKIKDSIESEVYDEGYVLQLDPKRRNFLVDANYTLEQNQIQLDQLYQRKIDSLGTFTENAKNEIPKKVGDAIRSSFTAVQASLMNRPSYKWYQFKKRAKNKAIKRLNELNVRMTNQTNAALKESNEKFASNIENQLQEALDRSDMKVDTIGMKSKKLVSRTLVNLRKEAYKYVSGTYYTLKTAEHILNFLLIIAIIKSLLYVFTRVLYKKDSGVAFSIDYEPFYRKGELTKYKDRFVIPKQTKKTYYFKRSIGPSGGSQSLSFPQITRCTLTRLFSFCLPMDKIEMKENDYRIQLDLMENQRIVKYKLLKDEQCIFNFENFVAIEKGVKLKTIFRFELACFLFQKIRYSVAEGPGELILSTKGSCIISPEQGSKISQPLYRIIAFQKKAKFHVASTLKLKDVFFSDFNIVKENNANIIIDSSGNRKKYIGVVKFFWRFLIPFS
ncbi:hypothetical protein [Flagellimonas meishanensis]|uniref:hypothetical protein n=1 Tax=Flagellimonas meishanensis TaxID=2873264 RepID=UPI001CA7801F|nr:hypothetical protein [[Muricauda] meishanensis]